MGSIEVINKLDKDVNVEVNDGKIIITWKENEKRRLGDLKPGDAFKDKEGTEYIVCEQLFGKTAVVRKDVLEKKMKFGENNDWRESNPREYLNGEYLKELENIFGAENIIAHEVDLTSLDGYDDYGVCTDKVACMAILEYMKYHRHIGDCDESHFLATPDSTPSGCGSDDVQCVGSNGYVSFNWYSYVSGVRPFFILKSDIFVS